MSVRHRFTERVRDIARRLGRPGAMERHAKGRAIFRLMYERFREILSLNDATLELIADIDERLAGSIPFSIDGMIGRTRKSAMDIFVLVKDLNQISGNRFTELYETVRRLSDALEEAFASAGREISEGPLTESLAALRAADSARVGAKMANLGELAGLGVRVPRGFVVTAVAFQRFMSEGELWERCERLETVLELEPPEVFADACREVQSAILRTPVPGAVVEALAAEYRETFGGSAPRVAVRSSAIGEDSLISSRAGLYQSVLDVEEASLEAAYRAVIASAFSPAAVSYHFERGLAARDVPMAVGVVEMFAPRCAGIMYSRDPRDVTADIVLISAVAGLSAGVTSGAQEAEMLAVGPEAGGAGTSSQLAPAEIHRLREAARRLEAHFGHAQDIEWAVEESGAVVLLQARPMVPTGDANLPRSAIETDALPLIEGGATAAPGAAAGRVCRVGDEEDLARVPAGSILVARHSSPSFAQVMSRCAAIVTDVGSPTGHMASLAREFGIPAVVGCAVATRVLGQDRLVTVDATACRVYDGAIAGIPARPTRAVSDSPAGERLRRMAALLTPLTLTDPASPDFRPTRCRSLHDVTRFVHEKAYEVMFHYGDFADTERDGAVRLDARLPIIVDVFDVGGGLTRDSAGREVISPEEVLSPPMRAFLEGLLEPSIRWDLPRPVSMRGFLSVLGESMAGPPTEMRRIGRTSYAIISDRYMNFSMKAGYHFSTIDTYCGRSQNKNYVHFRFSGGAADAGRQRLRIRFLSTVLAALDFKVQQRGEMLVARLDKYADTDILPRLTTLGRLTLCARQLDMLMDNDSAPDSFAHAFLERDWKRF